MLPKAAYGLGGKCVYFVFFLQRVYMPYKIVKEAEGFKVCSPKHCLSKKPMTKKAAMKQRVAVALSESRKSKKPVGAYFA